MAENGLTGGDNQVSSVPAAAADASVTPTVAKRLHEEVRGTPTVWRYDKPIFFVHERRMF